MKIGIYNPRVGIASAGGTEIFLREMMKRIQKNQDIVLYCGSGKILPEVEELPIKIRKIPFMNKESRSNAIFPRYSPLLPAEVESASMFYNAKRNGTLSDIEDEVDVISTHYYLDNLLISRFVDVPNLFRFPGIKQPSPRWKAMARWADTDTIIANSEATAARIQDWLDLGTDGIVYAGVDKNQFTAEAEPAFEEEKVTILYVGRLDKGKGLHELIEAQARLGDTTRLYLVGDGTLASDLKKKVADRGLSGSVQFVGSIPHDEIHRYYAAADIFCLPSHHESLGMVNLEAMSTGTPVVTTHIDAIEEYIEDDKNGLLVPVGDVDALTQSLSRLAGDPDLRVRLGFAAQTTAARFSWTSQAKKMEEFYKETATQ